MGSQDVSKGYDPYSDYQVSLGTHFFRYQAEQMLTHRLNGWDGVTVYGCSYRMLYVIISFIKANHR
jgi:hypothetical protein